MPENSSAKRIVIDVSGIEILKTADGKFFVPGPLGLLKEIDPEKESGAKDVILLLESADRLNSPGGRNFEAAKKLLEQYRTLALITGHGGGEDRFDLPGPNARPADEAPAPQNEADGDPSLSKTRSAAELMSRLDSCLEAMLGSSCEEFLDAGELIYARFVKPEYSLKQTDFYLALFKCSRATYFRLINRAIGILSRLMFGL